MPPFPASNITVVPSAPFQQKPEAFSRPAQTMRIGENLSLEQAHKLIEQFNKTIADQARRIRQLENLALTDELTGLLNRRGFMNTLRRELGQSRRNKKHSALFVMLDLDGFKQINDTYGHAVGDAYLQSVATVLLNEVRSTDFVARLGGDEFALLLTGICAKDAGRRLEKLDQTLNARVMHSHGLSLPLCASFGFALVSESETAESLFVTADMKLYSNKAQRRKEALKEMN